MRAGSSQVAKGQLVSTPAEFEFGGWSGPTAATITLENNLYSQAYLYSVGASSDRRNGKAMPPFAALHDTVSRWRGRARGKPPVAPRRQRRGLIFLSQVIQRKLGTSKVYSDHWDKS
jgi:hypothetical protein